MTPRCPTCGAVYTQVGDADEGYFRSLCECEAAHSCNLCKRGSKKPINQASLNLDFEVRHYLCAEHGYYEAEEFPALAPKEPAKKRTAVYVAEPKAPEPKEDTRSGQIIVARTYGKPAELTWAELKKCVREAMKSPAGKQRVRCSACGDIHTEGSRKIESDDKAHTLRIVCPKCGGSSYHIL